MRSLGKGTPIMTKGMSTTPIKQPLNLNTHRYCHQRKYCNKSVVFISSYISVRPWYKT